MREIEHTFDHRLLVLLHHSFAQALSDEHLDLVRTVGMFDAVRIANGGADQPQEQPGRAVEQPDRRRRHAVEGEERTGEVTTHRLRTQERDGLRSEFAEYDVEVRDEDEGDDDGRRVECRRPRGEAQRAEQRLDRPGDRRLADPAQAERREGDPELGTRDGAVEIALRPADNPGQTVAAIGQFVYAGASRADERKLRRDEEGVRRYERENRAEPQNESEVHSAVRLTDGVAPGLSGGGGSFRLRYLAGGPGSDC